MSRYLPHFGRFWDRLFGPSGGGIDAVGLAFRDDGDFAIIRRDLMRVEVYSTAGGVVSLSRHFPLPVQIARPVDIAAHERGWVVTGTNSEGTSEARLLDLEGAMIEGPFAIDISSQRSGGVAVADDELGQGTIYLLFHYADGFETGYRIVRYFVEDDGTITRHSVEFNLVVSAATETFAQMAADGNRLYLLTEGDCQLCAFDLQGYRDQAIPNLDLPNGTTGIDFHQGTLRALDADRAKIRAWSRETLAAFEGNDFAEADWNDVERVVVNPTDAWGIDQSIKYRAAEWEAGNGIIAMRRELPQDHDDIGTRLYSQVGLQLTGPVLETNGTFAFPVRRTAAARNFDSGHAADVLPPLDERYTLKLLMPSLPSITGYPTLRKPGLFFANVSATLAAEMQDDTDDDPWPPIAVIYANQATPGENAIGDTVTLYRGDFRSTRTWDGTNWIAAAQFIDGNLVVRNSIVADALAANAVTADKLLIGPGLVATNNAISLGVASAGGIEVADGLAQLKNASASGINVDADGISIAHASNGGLEVDADNNIRVKNAAASAINIDDNGISLNFASNGGLEISNDALRLKNAASSAINIGANGISLAFAANGGLEVSNNELQVKTSGASGISIGASGIGLNVANNSGINVTNDGITLAVANAGGIEISNNQISLKTANTALTVGPAGLNISLGTGLMVENDAIAIDPASVPAGRDGTDGTDGTNGADGHSYASGTVWATTAGDPGSQPTATGVSSSGQLTGLSGGWSSTPPLIAVATTGLSTHYLSTWTARRTSRFGAWNITFAQRSIGLNLNGLITFTNGHFRTAAGNITTIDGGDIDTGTITLNKLASSSGDGTVAGSSGRFFALNSTASGHMVADESTVGYFESDRDFALGVEARAGADGAFGALSRATGGAGIFINRNGRSDNNRRITLANSANQIEGQGLSADWTGALTASGMAQTSDLRHKDDLRPITGALSKVNQLTGYTYHYAFANGNSRKAGLVAQEVESVLPEAVNGADSLSVEPMGVVGLLVNAVKELTARVEELERERR